MTAYRFDASELKNAQMSAEGYLRVNATPTRAGILQYKTADGKVRRELRPEAEVFHADSLASLELKPLTEDHPGVVTSANVRSVRVGAVLARPSRNGDHLDAIVQVEDADTVAKVQSGALKELSCGYTCEYDPTPGTWRGQRYDGVQRRIVYNHVALLPAGAGRAGAQCSLRMDAAEGEDVDVAVAVVADAIECKEKTMKIGDKEIRLDAADELVLLGALEGHKAEVAKLQAERDAAKAQATELQARADAAEKVAARGTLEAKASEVLRQDWTGKSDAEVQTAVIAHVMPGVRLDGKDATYLAVMFDAACQLPAVAARETAVGAAVKTVANVSEYDQMVARRRAMSEGK